MKTNHSEIPNNSKQIEEFTKWCAENHITWGKDAKTESVMVADWWLNKLSSQLKQLELAIADEINEAHFAGERTSRLTSLYLKINGDKPLDILERVREKCCEECKLKI